MESKIQILLKQAEREAQSDSRKASSTASAACEFPTSQETESNFQKFKNKLFHIERWNNESSISSFELYNENGAKRFDNRAETGNFVKVTLYGSGKADWVKIIEIYEAPDEVVLTVQPSEDPTGEDSDKTVISHFFTPETTNNFCLQKKDNKITLYVIGLSEITNTENTGNILETVRNLATSNIGHYLGVQKFEWTSFCNNFLEREKSEDQTDE